MRVAAADRSAADPAPDLAFVQPAPAGGRSVHERERVRIRRRPGVTTFVQLESAGGRSVHERERAGSVPLARQR